MASKQERSFDVIDNELRIRHNGMTLALAFSAPDILRLRFANGSDIPIEETHVVEHAPGPLPFSVTRRAGKLTLRTSALSVSISLDSLAIEVRDSDNRLRVALPAGQCIEAREKSVILRLNLQPGERICGLGQDPMARLDHRGYERRMWQEWNYYRRSGNAGMPFCLSSVGYALLLNSSWPSRFAVGEAQVMPAPSEFARSLAPAPWSYDTHSGERDPDRMAIVLDSNVMDVFLVCRDGVDAQHAAYYTLTGRPPLLPRWAFGYIQCKNRYRSQEELLSIARGYRRRNIPCDALVIDWLWFKQFGDLEWDREAWPNPRSMCKELAKLGFRVMQAQHPFVERTSLKYEAFRQAGWLNTLPSENDRPTVDHSNPAARGGWWREIRRFYEDGIRGYWTDMGELENHPKGVEHQLGPRERVHNIYSTLWMKGLYEHQRAEFPERVFSLPRTSYPGIHRYGTAMWSGDIDATWEVFRDQIVIGQGVCLSGQPLWTTDIGGFFTGQEFTPELYVRWLQWGVFCPIFRTHGTRPGNEPWSFGAEAEAIIAEFIRLRYRLMPYIYSLARRVHDTGQPIMRAMSVDFPDDPEAVAQERQFMFGPAFLVAPVTEPGGRTRRVYLPAGAWYDFWTDERFEGPCWIEAEAPLDRIPLYVRAGSVVPMLPKAPQSAMEPWTNVEIHAWPGAAGRFDLYDDDGLTYGYEQGACAKTPLFTDRAGRVRIGRPMGDRSCIPGSRRYRTVTHLCTAVTGKRSAMDTHVDCVTYTDGRCVVRATVINRTGKPLALKLRASTPSGWTLLSSPVLLFGRAQPESNHTIEKRGDFTWELRPTATALPVFGRGEIIVETTVDKRVQRETWSYAAGNGWATRWSIAQHFPNDRANTGLDRVYEPERNADTCGFKVEGTDIPYRRITREEFNCFGYVDLRAAELLLYKDDLGLSYARCRVWSPGKRKLSIEFGVEGSGKVWINGKQVLRCGNVALSRIHDPIVRLRRGWNEILIKVSLSKLYPWSGRDFGFNFRLVNAAGAPEEDLLYQP